MTDKHRGNSLYHMGLYETLCFMMADELTYVFRIRKGSAQVHSRPGYPLYTRGL